MTMAMRTVRRVNKSNAKTNGKRPNGTGATENDFGTLVRQFRLEHDMTQQQVADSAGCSTGYIGLIEQGQRGARPTRDMVLKFAQALDLGPDKTEELFRAAGHLAADESLYAGQDSTVVNALMTDKSLPDASKRLMIQLYHSLSRPRARR